MVPNSLVHGKRMCHNPLHPRLGAHGVVTLPLTTTFLSPMIVCDALFDSINERVSFNMNISAGAWWNWSLARQPRNWRSNYIRTARAGSQLLVPDTIKIYQAASQTYRRSDVMIMHGSYISVVKIRRYRHVTPPMGGMWQDYSDSLGSPWFTSVSRPHVRSDLFCYELSRPAKLSTAARIPNVKIRYPSSAPDSIHIQYSSNLLLVTDLTMDMFSLISKAAVTRLPSALIPHTLVHSNHYQVISDRVALLTDLPMS